MVVTSRLLEEYRLHASVGEQSTAGKSEVVRAVLSTLPDSVALYLGGGATKRALQYYGDLSRRVIFIDEADALEGELRAMLREALTKPEVTRLVTTRDHESRFTATSYRVITEGMVLIQAGTAVIANPADETRFLLLNPDVSTEQTARIMDRQGESAANFTPGLTSELEAWRKAQELLQPCVVIIPYAPQLRRLLPSDMLRLRRDFPRLLSLIAAHACLYQRQRSRYEVEGHLIVEAELTDYYRIHEFAASLFAEATRGLTPTQQNVVTAIRRQRQRGQRFTTDEAADWTESAYSTVRGHLLDLEELGLVESSMNRGKRMWSVVADSPRGLQLPSPEQLINEVHSQTQ